MRSVISPHFRNHWDLLAISVLSLYLELAMIRLLASEIRVFAYFKNFPLLAAVIALGLGCYVADRRPIRWSWAIGLLLAISLTASFSETLRLTDLFFPDPALYTWRGSILSPTLLGQVHHYPGLGSLLGKVPDGLLLMLIGVMSFGIITVLFAASAAIFYPIGQETGRLFRPLRPLTAYSINVAGGLIGSVAFALVSYLELGPRTWLLPCFALLCYFAWTRHAAAAGWLGAVAAITLALILSSDVEGKRVIWSPYYRISVTQGIPEDQRQGWTVRVNHDYFQRAADLSDAALGASTSLGPVRDYYDLPYHLRRLVGPLGRVLIVGAGTGNDAAAALRASALDVVAVDIDPAIVRLGMDLHPEQPYRVGGARTVVDDARAFFRRNAYDPIGERFDLLVFGLLDSQTALSAMSSVRLEFYVYTVESLREALRMIDPDRGLMVISFSVGWRDWVGERIYASLAEASGEPPMVLQSTAYDGGLTFVAGPGLKRIDRGQLGTFRAKDLTGQYDRGRVSPARDDWPFLYVNPHYWPWVYLLALALLLFGGWAMVWRVIRAMAPEETQVQHQGPRFDLHMFLMGAAFMLVETSAIARLSLVFGATWYVNAAVISAVLVMILAANALVASGRAPSVWLCYGLLGGALLVVWAVPFEVFLTIPLGHVLAALTVALPVFGSGLVFAAAFRDRASANLALGCNILGAILGGVLEAASLAVGIRALTVVALAIYLVSAAVLMHERRAWRAPMAL